MSLTLQIHNAALEVGRQMVQFADDFANPHEFFKGEIDNIEDPAFLAVLPTMGFNSVAELASRCEYLTTSYSDEFLTYPEMEQQFNAEYTYWVFNMDILLHLPPSKLWQKVLQLYKPWKLYAAEMLYFFNVITARMPVNEHRAGFGLTRNILTSGRTKLQAQINDIDRAMCTTQDWVNEFKLSQDIRNLAATSRAGAAGLKHVVQRKGDVATAVEEFLGTPGSDHVARMRQRAEEMREANMAADAAKAAKKQRSLGQTGPAEDPPSSAGGGGASTSLRAGARKWKV